MAKGNKSKSAKTTNQKKHKENLSKELRKKRIQKQKENEKQYAYNGGGTKVVQRTRRDVSAAPAMKGEKIKKGYVSTYPVVENTSSGQGFFDQRLMLNEYLARGEKQLSFNSFMRNMTSKMNPEQMHELMTTNEDLVKKAAVQQDLATIDAAKTELFTHEQQIERLRMKLGIDENDVYDKAFLNRELLKYERQRDEHKKNIQDLGKIEEMYDSAVKARDEQQLEEERMKGRKEAYIQRLQKEKEGKCMREARARDREIEHIKNLDANDLAGWEGYVKPLTTQMEDCKKAGKLLEELTRLQDDWVNDQNALAVGFAQIKEAGFEDPKVVQQMVEIEAKIRQRADIHGSMDELTKHITLLQKQKRDKDAEILKVGRKAIEDRRKHEQELAEYNQRLKDIMINNKWFGKADEDQIMHNDFARNTHLFNQKVSQLEERHIELTEDCRNTRRALKLLEAQKFFKDDEEMERKTNKWWRTLEEYIGEIEAREMRYRKYEEEENFYEDYNEEQTENEEETHEGPPISFGGINYDENTKLLFGDSDENGEPLIGGWI